MRWTDILTRVGLVLVIPGCGRDSKLADLVILDADVLTMSEANAWVTPGSFFACLAAFARGARMLST
jgi:hypothetical protein